MAIINGTVLENATGASYSVGTSKTWALTGQPVVGGINVAFMTDTDYRTRRNASFKSRVPQVRNGKFGLARAQALYVVPILLESDGSVVFNTLRMQLDTHPELPLAGLSDMLLIGSQLLTDAQYSGFWKTGALI
jgi:hypothetical protein